MVSALTKLVLFSHRHPLALGVMSYATLWPTSSIIQQTMAGKNITNYDYLQAARFSVFGSMFSAPTLYFWLKFLRKVVPGNNLKSAVLKAAIEQASYGPVHLASFFFGMSLLEGKKMEQAKQEVEVKFLPTWKIGVCVWPFLATFNHAYLKERHKVPFASCCSLLWTCFLAYMHQLKREENNRDQPVEKSMVALQRH